VPQKGNNSFKNLIKFKNSKINKKKKKVSSKFSKKFNISKISKIIEFS
jgi:hypothetical protein